MSIPFLRLPFGLITKELQHNISEDLAVLIPSTEVCEIVASIAVGVLERNAAAIDACKSFKTLLCTRVLTKPGPQGGRLVASLQRAAVIGKDYSVYDGEALAFVTQALFLFWKQEYVLGKAELEQSFDALRTRLRTSGKPNLPQVFREQMRIELAKLGAPPYWEKMAGRNGPGAVADGYKGADRWWFTNHPRGVPAMFYRFSVDDWACRPIRPIKYGITKATLVPKDIRGPRAISEEPLAFQHAQFAISDWLSMRGHKVFPKHMSLHDQAHHCRFLTSKRYVTIDLSDASDLISRRLIYQTWPSEIRAMLFECRSSFAKLPSGVTPLRTFAPMGSSLCFIVMTLTIIAALRAAGVTRPFSVYGDDMIVDQDDLPIALDALKWLGVKVNASKTTLPLADFRESCGHDYIWGPDAVRYWAKPVFIKASLREVSVVSGLRILFRVTDLRVIGFHRLAARLESGVLQLFPRLGEVRKRHHAEYQRPIYAFQGLKPLKNVTDTADGLPGLYRWFVMRRETPLEAASLPRGRPTVGVQTIRSFKTPACGGLMEELTT